MNKADYQDMCERKERWAEAACAVALVREAMEGMGGEGTGVAADMQDCLKVRSKVRIG